VQKKEDLKMAVWLLVVGPDLIVLLAACEAVDLPTTLESPKTLHVIDKDWRQPPSIAV
jgi:hypothetical protein